MTGVDVVGELTADYALNVDLDDLEETYWIVPELLEFIDHGPGQVAEVRLPSGPKRWVRAETGEWIEIPT